MLAPAAGALITVRVIQGLASGVMVPQVFDIMRASFAPAALAKAFGAYARSSRLALVGGSLVNTDLRVLRWMRW